MAANPIQPNSKINHWLTRQTLALLGLWALVAIGLTSTAQLTHAANNPIFSAQVDRNHLAINETFTLTLSYQGQAFSSPDFSSLETDFSILSRQSESQLSFGTRNDTSQTHWILSLNAKRTGQLRLPALHFKGNTSQAIDITVTDIVARKPSQKATDTQIPIFIETEVDQRSAYVQSQILLTLRLNTAVRLSSLDIDELIIADARIVKINDNSQYQKTINGKKHLVVEMQYAIFPEKAGTISIPSLTITGIIPDRNDPFGGRSPFSNRGTPVYLHSDNIEIDVLAKPASLKGRVWLPAKGLSLSQRWSNSPGHTTANNANANNNSNTLTVGEPVTRAITVVAQGVTGAQIPPLNLPTIDGVKFYPDQADISETLSTTGILGTRTEATAIVPTLPGTLVLPEIVVQWWDTNARAIRETRLEAKTFTVVAADSSNNNPTQNPVNSNETAEAGPARPTNGAGQNNSQALLENPILVVLSLALNGLLILVLASWLFFRKKAAPAPAAAKPTAPLWQQEKQAFKHLKKANTNNPAQVRSQLLQWAALFWPDASIQSLAQIASLSDDPQLKILFAKLDKSLYGSHAQGQENPLLAATFADILSALQQLRNNDGKQTPSKSSLQPLYPQ